ncbi:MAG TPA: S8 family serine peptidase [Thermoanaerobaculia bacterium]|nr:S8 family serine peptidase [Thermoanaerobaculia bacterium]
MSDHFSCGAALPQPAVEQPDQGYLDGGGWGIAAAAAWALAGGRGEGMSFADVEQGWQPEHENLPSARIKRPILGDNHFFFGHGTAVLGVVAAAPEAGIGVHGIAPRVEAIHLSSEWLTPSLHSTARAIERASRQLGRGDVLLIESETGGFDLPAEAEPAVFAAIRAATRRGIVVVEAAGNGGREIDGCLLGDSGAILVGAVAVPSRRRLRGCNFGRRIDCFAWGEGVFTTGDGGSGDDPAVYTNNFSGTSAAAAIVAGAALVVQGIARARRGRPFTPAALRGILGAEANGTPPAQQDRQRVGIMPDLAKIIANHRLTAPCPSLYNLPARRSGAARTG